MTKEKNPVGRPKKFDNPKQMMDLFKAWLEECIEKDEDGKFVDYRRPLTVSGLALALGFKSRQSLLNYAQDGEFLDTIKEMKLHVEIFTEEQLYARNVAGPIFSLINNFENWKNKSETDNTHRGSITWHEEKTYLKEPPKE